LTAEKYVLLMFVVDRKLRLLRIEKLNRCAVANPPPSLTDTKYTKPYKISRALFAAC